MAENVIEKRVLKVEYRVTKNDDGSLPKIEGYAAVFDKDSEYMGFIERIAPGAFKGALKVSDARALFNHDSNIVLGRQSSGTLRLVEDKTGLHMSVDPPDTQLVRDMVMTPIERGDVTEQSFGFSIEADEWKNLDKDVPIRTITKIERIYDVSPVTFPAYPDTNVALRSMEQARQATETASATADFVALSERCTVSIGDSESPFDTADAAVEFLTALINLRDAPGSDDPGAGDSDEPPELDETTKKLLTFGKG